MRNVTLLHNPVLEYRADTWQSGPGTGWAALQSVLGWGGLVSSPTIRKEANGAFTAFAINTNGALLTSWQTSPGSTWQPWVSLGGNTVTVSGIPTVLTSSNGGLVVFARGTDGQLYNTWQSGPGTGWAAWQAVVGGAIVA